jgi:hypothetical protein
VQLLVDLFLERFEVVELLELGKVYLKCFKPRVHRTLRWFRNGAQQAIANHRLHLEGHVLLNVIVGGQYATEVVVRSVAYGLNLLREIGPDIVEFVHINLYLEKFANVCCTGDRLL